MSRVAFHRLPTPAAQELLVYVFCQECVHRLCDSLEQSRWHSVHAYDCARQRSFTGVSVLEQGLNLALRSSLWVGVQLVGSCCRVQEPSDNDWPVSMWLFPWPSQLWVEDRTGSGMVLSSIANVSVGAPLNNNPITCLEVLERFRGWGWVAVCRYTSEKRQYLKEDLKGS